MWEQQGSYPEGETEGHQVHPRSPGTDRSDHEARERYDQEDDDQSFHA